MQKYKIVLYSEKSVLEDKTLYVKPLNGAIEYLFLDKNGNKTQGRINDKKLFFPVAQDSDLMWIRQHSGNIFTGLRSAGLMSEPVKFFIYPFGTSGDRTTVPDGAQLDGSMSYDQGFTPPYEGDYPTDPTAIPVPRTQTNQYLYDITNALQQYQSEGFPDFITTADNGGFPWPYDIYAIVRYDPGTGVQLYMSTTSGNTNLPTNTATWRQIAFPMPLIAQISMSTPQTPPASVDSLVQFQYNPANGDFDPSAMWTGSPNFSFLPLRPGYYSLSTYLHLGNTATTVFLKVYKNGAFYKELYTFPCASLSGNPPLGISGDILIPMNGSTDYVQLYFNPGASGIIAINGNPAQNYIQFNYEKSLN
jgi:hypothetical protein